MYSLLILHPASKLVSRVCYETTVVYGLMGSTRCLVLYATIYTLVAVGGIYILLSREFHLD